MANTLAYYDTELITTLVYYLRARLEPTLRTYLTNVELTGSGKHSSLLRYVPNNNCKQFYETVPWTEGTLTDIHKTFYDRSYGNGALS